jgi:hypothetical protein
MPDLIQILSVSWTFFVCKGIKDAVLFNTPSMNLIRISKGKILGEAKNQ